MLPFPYFKALVWSLCRTITPLCWALPRLTHAALATDPRRGGFCSMGLTITALAACLCVARFHNNPGLKEAFFSVSHCLSSLEICLNLRSLVKIPELTQEPNSNTSYVTRCLRPRGVRSPHRRRPILGEMCGESPRCAIPAELMSCPICQKVLPMALRSISSAGPLPLSVLLTRRKLERMVFVPFPFSLAPLLSLFD